MNEKESKKEEFLKKFEFTSCDDCVNKINKVYQNECINCRYYYPDLFQKK